jgi:hypothetical protein
MSAPQMRHPAPRVDAGNRAEVVRNNTSHLTIDRTEPEADFSVVYVARRFHLPMPTAAVVVGLAGFGRAFH